MKSHPATRLLASGELQVVLAEPMPVPQSRFVARNSLLERCRSAWGIERGAEGTYRCAEPSCAMSFRLEGPSGSGKNELVYQLARELGRDLYMQSGHEDLTPEDLSLLLVPASTTRCGLPLVVRASPLATAILEGGLFFFDDIHRVPERTLATLASVLDDRHELYSAATGVWIKAADEPALRAFRFCCALDPTAGGKLPTYIEQRTTPRIVVPMPDAHELRKMVEWNVKIQGQDMSAFEASYESCEEIEAEELGELRERELLARLLRLQMEDRRRRFAKAMAQAQAGRWADAAERFEAISRELPRQDEMRWQCENNRSHCLMELGDLKKAQRVCEEILDEAPDFAIAVCTLADTFFKGAELSQRAKHRRRLQKLSCSFYQRALELPSLEFHGRQHAAARLIALERFGTNGGKKHA